ncbi:MAG: ABC transporter ATP-binding protein [Alphaproteobacteria bacterium]|nr:ABC transporter ATP-binding protein [Alphaproteobacteria bacterium]
MGLGEDGAGSAPGALSCRNLRKTFGGTVRALDDVSIDIAAGEFFTLLGPSGCGKTTLLRAIAGFEAQDSGTIHLGGQPLDGLAPPQRPVNTVFQSYAVFPHMTVAENVGFALEMQRRPKAVIAARVEEMLALVRLQGLGGRKPSQLSGGQQQRVALARALAATPRLLLLDEPLSALDLKLRNEMRLELKRLQSETGITFVFVTHDQHEALTMSDRIAVMRDGKVLQVGTPTEIYERPALRFVADFIGEANLLEATRIAPGRFRLAGGAELDAAEDTGPTGPVTLVLRPERAHLAGPDEAEGQSLAGAVEQVVYDGADTTYHIALDSGATLRLREPSHGAPAQARAGDSVRVRIDPASLRAVPD